MEKTYKIVCPVCQSGELKETEHIGEYMCIQCKLEYALTLQMTLLPSYNPIGFIHPHDDDPYP